MLRLLSLSVFLAITVAAAPAQASIIAVSSFANLYPTDSLGWIAPEFTSYVPGDTLSTANNVNVTLGGASAFTVFTGSTYNADFLPTASVLSAFDLSTGPVDGPIRLSFSELFAGVGAQIQSNDAGPFVATLRAFGSANNLLGSVTILGTNGQNGDGSAAFLGLASTALDIAFVEFDAGPGMAINTVGLTTQPVPEPSTLVLTALGLGVACVRRRRARR